MTAIISPSIRLITAINLISRAMHLINAIPAGKTVSGSEAADGLSTLNEMIESWSTETISVYGKVNEIYNLTADVDTYTYGIGGDFDVIRPAYINAAYSVVDGVSREIRVVNQLEYNKISLKSQKSRWPSKLLYVNSYPLGQLTVLPVPTEALQLVLTVPRQLDVIINYSQEILLPPGYLRALRYSLAVELWPEYANSSTDINTIKSIATGAKADIQRSNQTDPIAFFDDVPGVDRMFAQEQGWI